MWVERTNAFSYIVLRTICLFFLDDFLLLEVPYTSAKVTDFIIQKFTTPEFQEALRKVRVPDKDKQHMRMTRFGDF
jgi:hypothetical protein